MTLRADCIDTTHRPKKNQKRAPENRRTQKNKMTTAPKKNQKDAAQKSGRGRGAPLGNKNGIGNKSRTGQKRTDTGLKTSPLNPGEQTQQIFIRLTKSDAIRLQVAADNAGKNKSAFIRDLILQNL